MPCKPVATILAAALLSITIPAGAAVVDQRDPTYQVAFEHLARASQMILKAQEEIQAAQEKHSMYGFDYSLLLQQLNLANDTLEPVLYPEERRQRHQILVPEGAFFHRSPYK